MSEQKPLSQKIRSGIDGVLCRSMVKRVFPLPPGRYVSLCFDDFPKSAATVGAPMVEAMGWNATFYVAGSYLGAEREHFGEMFDEGDLRRLARQGHDFGCHTFDNLNCAKARPIEIYDQRRKNRAFFRSHGIARVRSFAYPFGAADLSAKKALTEDNLALRGVKPGINRSVADFNILKANGLQASQGGILRALEELEMLCASDGWMIIFTHDVSPDPSPWGVTPEDLEHVLTAVRASGAEVVTVGDMVDRILSNEQQADVRAA
jgi:peptidoglycan/xylan/chitin deacetylase (PgdA/CDA1 family)